ncbi:hypothetical protein TWF970_007696 [Orbilia oligospora]|uniref:Uncharacterized protein n=1 Tax=Orbilia oligospora TaxID=2813651 RepID=A0A7C8VDG2_ORBOL|nr:hypothetical protein TWF970_007696 [Orbilia oligospora]
MINIPIDHGPDVRIRFLVPGPPETGETDRFLDGERVFANLQCTPPTPNLRNIVDYNTAPTHLQVWFFARQAAAETPTFPPSPVESGQASEELPNFYVEPSSRLPQLRSVPTYCFNATVQVKFCDPASATYPAPVACVDIYWHKGLDIADRKGNGLLFALTATRDETH